MSVFADDFPMIMEREAGMPEDVPAVAVAFGIYPHENTTKSAEFGRPVFEDREYVKIAVPGDKMSMVLQPATEAHKRRFPRAYKAFLERETTPTEGTPIEQWPAMSRGMAMTLRAAHIHTVEALAEVHEGHADKLGFHDARAYIAKAKAFLKQATDSAAAQKAAAENQQLKDEMAEMQRQIAELSARLSDPDPKGKKAA